MMQAGIKAQACGKTDTTTDTEIQTDYCKKCPILADAVHIIKEQIYSWLVRFWLKKDAKADKTHLLQCCRDLRK